MSKIFKKIVILVPILIISFFVGFNNQINAADVQDAYIESKIPDIYFNNKNSITITTVRQKYFEHYIKYRVISPKGIDPLLPDKRMATDWIKKNHGEDAKTKLYSFEINFNNLYFDLPFSEENTLEPSAVPAATYYIEIDYYRSIIVYSEKFASNSIKLVRVKEKPEIAIVKNGTAYNAIATTTGYLTEAKYFYSTINPREMSQVALENGYNEYNGEYKKNITNEINSGQLNLEVSELAAIGNEGYVYFLVKDGNENFAYNWINLSNGESGTNKGNTSGTDQQPNAAAKKYGDIILIILVSILIITSSLMISQKIVDRKKHL